MSLVSMKYILDDANARGYAVGAFNVNNLEFAKAVIAAASEADSPVIIQASEGAVSYAGLQPLVAIVRSLAESTRVPVALHLDHGKSFDVVIGCIRHGFTSVMIDGSHLPFAENVAITRKIVEIARAAGVTVEAEIGRLAGIEDNVAVAEREALLTDPRRPRPSLSRLGAMRLRLPSARRMGHGSSRASRSWPSTSLPASRNRSSCRLFSTAHRACWQLWLRTANGHGPLGLQGHP